MPNVDITFEGYSGNAGGVPRIANPTKAASVTESMELSRLKLALHAMCCGYLNLRDLSRASLTWRVSRLLRALACIEEDSNNNRLMPTREYRDADATEKGQLSEMLGMAMTRAVAAEFFRVPWVCQTSKMKGRHGYKLVASTDADMKPRYNPGGDGKEADLIGFDCCGNPHCFEAKGTCGDATMPRDRQKAINQASVSRGIEDANGEKLFVTRNACCFTFKDGFKGGGDRPSGDCSQFGCLSIRAVRSPVR